ncbi:hypothetical protein [Taibaiella helva]|nr:hypothetical protein [Taibaiella helva]
MALIQVGSINSFAVAPAAKVAAAAAPPEKRTQLLRAEGNASVLILNRY